MELNLHLAYFHQCLIMQCKGSVLQSLPSKNRKLYLKQSYLYFYCFMLISHSILRPICI